MPTFGELLIKYTERAGISDAELARTTGVQRQTIFRWKEGLVARPRYREDVLRIAAKLRLAPEERDELLLAGGFPPENPRAVTALLAAGPAAPAIALDADARASAGEDAAATTAEDNAPAPDDSQALSAQDASVPTAESIPARTPGRAAGPTRRARLIPRPGLLLGMAVLVMLAVAGGGVLVLTRLAPRPVTATPTPAAISSPTPLSTATPTPVPIVAKAGEKLIVVAPFVGYTSDALRFNVAGRIQEALSDEIARARLPDTRLALWPAPIVGLEEATQARGDSGASLMIWGEYDAGRVRAIVTMPGDQGSSWVNPVASPADLPLVINEEVPQSARIFALYALGQLYRKEQDAASALKLFESALKLDPKDPQTRAALHFYVGTLLPDVRGRTPEVISEAISHFDAALALRPAWSNLRYNRGTAYLGRALLSPVEGADLDEAIADLGQVIAAQPWQEDPYLNRGIAYYQRNRPDDLALAMADFGRAIEIAPEDDRGYYHRALAAIRAGDEDVWRADLTRGQAISPGYAPILNAWCWAYATTARPDDALPYCEAAVDADPTGTSLDSRAIAYAQRGRHADAAADFTAYLAWVRQTYPALYDKYRGPAIERWIAELKVGRNPFTAEVLEMLRKG